MAATFPHSFSPHWLPFSIFHRHLKYQPKHLASTRNVTPDFNKQPSPRITQRSLNYYGLNPNYLDILRNNMKFKRENAAGGTAYPLKSFPENYHFQVIDGKEKRYGDDQRMSVVRLRRNLRYHYLVH